MVKDVWATVKVLESLKGEIFDAYVSIFLYGVLYLI